MTAADKAFIKQRNAQLKALREEHRDTVDRAKAYLKEQKAVRRQICQHLREPKTVPEVAEASGLPASVVLWHITAMKKYDRVAETGQCGDYYQYAIVKGAES